MQTAKPAAARIARAYGTWRTARRAESVQVGRHQLCCASALQDACAAVQALRRGCAPGLHAPVTALHIRPDVSRTNTTAQSAMQQGQEHACSSA